nr:frataxin [Melanopsichium pennsylvanicum 4]
MLRTTTQRGLMHSAALLPARSAAVSLGRTFPRSKASTSMAPALRISSRCFGSASVVAQPTAKYTASPLTDGEYHKLSDSLLDSLQETFETLLEEADVETLEHEARAKNQGATRGIPASEWDIESASGVMNLRCGVHGTWVINKQPPNKQIWLSSPKSGPKRFDYDATTRTWFCHKEGETSTLNDLLQAELSHVFNTQVEILLEDN